MATEEDSYSYGYVYVIKILNYYKIGKTINPKNRFYEYSRLMEFPEIIYCTFVKDFSMVENKLHKLFREKCTRGEWFHLEENDLKFIYNILERNRIVNNDVLSLEEIIKIQKKREEFINNINKDKIKNKHIKIKNKQETNKVANKKIIKKDNTLTEKEKQNEIKCKTHLIVGKIYRYKELCEIFNDNIKYGDSRNCQFKEWERYFKWSKITSQKYLIEEIYDIPKNKIDKRSNNGGVREGSGRKPKYKESIEEIENESK